jgi:OTU domain-containing protein 6
MNHKSTNSVEEEYAGKLKEMEERHRLEVTALGGGDTTVIDHVSGTNDGTAAVTSVTTAEDIAAMERQKKLEKIREQKEAERQRIIDQERQSIEDAKNIGPTLRDIEMQQITQQFQNQYQIQPIPADGNCLFRAIAAQCPASSTTEATNDPPMMSYQEIRALCAQTMLAHESEFAPFCEYNSDDITNYQEYTKAVQYSSHHWGGHLEIRALSMALQRPVHVYSSNTLHTKEPLIIDATAASSTTAATGSVSDHPAVVEPIRLSYHLHYYALGEHYNQVVAKGYDS